MPLRILRGAGDRHRCCRFHLSAFNGFSLDFRANWQGSLLAPETGEYEFLVKTENATRLWVNDKTRPLIDALVKSGSDTEYRGSAYLLGGRAYPLRLELSRTKENTSSITLEWKLPRRPFEVIPRRNLLPGSVPETFVLQTPFPPDDRSIGYERGTSVSKAWDQSTTDAAIEVAAHVVERLRELAGVGQDAPDREAKLRQLCHRFAEQAFRRPLTPAQNRSSSIASSRRPRTRSWPSSGLCSWCSSRLDFFTVRLAGAALTVTTWHPASRLGCGIHFQTKCCLMRRRSDNSVHGNRLSSQSERMVDDPRARWKLREFFLQWLRVEQVPDIAKDPKQYPQFNELIAADLRSSLTLFLDDIIGSESADFRQLLRADYVYLNGRLSQFYGAGLPADAPFQKVYLDQHERAGVLTHPYLMSSFAYTASSSPIHRGVFVARSILGRVLRPPPEAVAPLAPDLHPDLTTRQRVMLQTKPETCQSCHGMINSLGFTLEHFDAVGRYRKEEKGRPIDSTGSYETRNGEIVEFKDIRALATFLATT